MTTLHNYLIRTLSVYHNWHQTKHYNKIHWGVLVVFTLLVFGTISRWTPITFAADTVPPTAPINLTVVAISSSQINLSWTASTDDVGVTGYKIYRCAGSACAPTAQIAVSAVNSYSNTGLTASTAYTYAVSAYDAAGNESEKSVSASATMPSGLAANFPLEITNIKPAGTGSPAIPTTNRIFRAYPGIEYNIRPAVIGGLYPFTYSLSNAPAGMTINASTGEITWPNPQADSGTITLSVTDVENTTVKTTWAITVTTSGFLFVNSSYAGTQTGSITQPYSSIANLLAASGSVADITYFRGGTYPIPGTSESSLAGKSNNWLGYPGETANITGATGAYLRSGGAIYFDNLNLRDFSNYGIMVWGGHHYQTIRRTSWSNIVATSSINNNYGFIYATSTETTPGFYFVIQDSDFSNFTGASAIGSLYDTQKMLIENNYIHNSGGKGVSGINNGISAKYRTSRLTVRGNRVIMTDGFAFGRGSMNGAMVGTNGVDVSFNFFVNQSNGIVHNFNGGSWSTADSLKNFFFYRNTVVGKTAFELLDGTNCGANSQGPFNLNNNVIINSNTSSPGDYFTHDYISYGSSNSIESTSPWNCITNANNLKGTASQNIVDSSGNLTSGYSQYIGTRGWQIGVADTESPATPTILTATPVSSSQINLSWTASNDDVGVTGYNIYRCAGSACAPTVQIATSAVNSYSNTGLTASTAYTYAVSAYDAAGNESARSTSTSVTTIPANATGSVYYVSPTGSTSWPDCTAEGFPCLADSTSSGKQFLMASAGDTVYFLAGIYNPGNAPSWTTPAWNPANSGVAEKPITFKCLTPVTCTITHNTVGPSFGSATKNYITWDGFKGTKVSNQPIVKFGADHGILRNCEFMGFDYTTDGDNNPFVAGSGQTNTLIQNNYFHDLTGLGHNTAAILLYNTTNVIVEKNSFVNNTLGIYDKNNGQNNTFRLNFFYNNHESFLTKQDAGGPGTTNRYIYQNIFVDTTNQASDTISQQDQPYTSTNIQFYNNTIYKSLGTTGHYTYVMQQITNSHFWNNIVYGVGWIYHNAYSNDGKPTYMDYNIYYNAQKFYAGGSTKTSLADWQVSGLLLGGGNPDVNSYYEDPQFVNAGGSSPTDYKSSATQKNNGRGGSYASVIGAYITGDEIIGHQPTPDIQAPSIPTNLTATPTSSSQINLSWTASTDPAIAGQVTSGVAGYKIYRCDGSTCTPTTQIATSATNSYSNTGLIVSTAYTYVVSAYDNASPPNESEKSSSVSAATLAGFKPSDLNQDAKVDSLDFEIFKLDFNRTDKSVSDLNQDGIVDTRDLGIMMGEWSK